MKVLSIAHSENGGGIQTVFRINNSINNNDIEIITAFQSDEKSKADIELKRLSSIKNPLAKLIGYFFIPNNYYSIKKFLLNNKVDIIHLHGSVGLSLSILKAIKRYKGEAKIVLTAHGYGLICPNYSCFNYAKSTMCTECVVKGREARIIKNKCDRRGRLYSLIRYLDFKIRKKVSDNYLMYDLIITPSNFSNALHNDAQHKFNDVKTVPNPIEGNPLKFNPDTKENAIIFAGRFSPEKNITLLIDAVKLLLQEDKYRDVKLIIIGSGSEREKIVNKINELNICDRVLLSSGFLTKKELSNYLEKAKILVLPSSMPETFGLVLFEGVKHNMVPICRNIGAQAENINNIGIGYLYEDDDPKLLAESIKMALTTYNNNYDKFHVANRIIEERYSDSKYKHNIAAVYNELMNMR